MIKYVSLLALIKDFWLTGKKRCRLLLKVNMNNIVVQSEDQMQNWGPHTAVCHE